MSPYEPLYKVPRTTEACTGGVQKTFGSRLRHGCAARCCQRQARGKKRARNSLMGLEPAIGLEPMTCALRVRRTASRRSRHLSLTIPGGCSTSRMLLRSLISCEKDVNWESCYKGATKHN